MGLIDEGRIKFIANVLWNAYYAFKMNNEKKTILILVLILIKILMYAFLMVAYKPNFIFWIVKRSLLWKLLIKLLHSLPKIILQGRKTENVNGIINLTDKGIGVWQWALRARWIDYNTDFFFIDYNID